MNAPRRMSTPTYLLFMSQKKSPKKTKVHKKNVCLSHQLLCGFAKPRLDVVVALRTVLVMLEALLPFTMQEMCSTTPAALEVRRLPMGVSRFPMTAPLSCLSQTVRRHPVVTCKFLQSLTVRYQGVLRRQSVRQSYLFPKKRSEQQLLMFLLLAAELPENAKVAIDTLFDPAVNTAESFVQVVTSDLFPFTRRWDDLDALSSMNISSDLRSFSEHTDYSTLGVHTQHSEGRLCMLADLRDTREHRPVTLAAAMGRDVTLRLRRVKTAKRSVLQSALTLGFLTPFWLSRRWCGKVRSFAMDGSFRDLSTFLRKYRQSCEDASREGRPAGQVVATSFCRAQEPCLFEKVVAAQAIQALALGAREEVWFTFHECVLAVLSSSTTATTMKLRSVAPPRRKCSSAA